MRQEGHTADTGWRI